MKIKLMMTCLFALAAVALMAQPPHNPRGNLDTDADGLISLDEFVQGSQARFEKMDQDGDGYLSSSELDARAGRRGPGRHGGPGHMLLVQADGDADGAISAAEWETFLATVPADDGGQIDVDALREMVIANRPEGAPTGRGPRGPRGARLDLDQDGVFELEDLAAWFTELDRDENGVVEQAELRGRMRGPRGLGLLPAADTDRDHVITSEEWTTYVQSLPVDESGAIQLEAPCGHLANLDQDGDGVIQASDLLAWFNVLDANQDGNLTMDEFPRHRKGRRFSKRF